MSKWSEYDNLSLSAQDFNKRTRAAEIAVFVEIALPKLRDTARSLGWVLALHGSQARDLDLVAVPWTDRAVAPDELVKRLGDTCKDATGWGYRSGSWTEKPHGRRAMTIIGSSDVHLDISVMPLVAKPADPE